MSRLIECEEGCRLECSIVDDGFFDCVNECMRVCLANVAGELS